MQHGGGVSLFVELRCPVSGHGRSQRPAERAAIDLRDAALAVILLFVYPILGLVHSFTGWNGLGWPAVSLAAVTVAAVWRFTQRRSRVIAALLVLLGLATAPWVTVPVLVDAALRTGQVMAMLLALQVLADAITHGGYRAVVSVLLAHLRVRPVWLALLGGYVLTWGFLITSIPVMYAALWSDRRSPATNPDHAPTAGNTPNGAPATENGATVYREPRPAVDLGILLSRTFVAAALANPLQPSVALAIAIAGVRPFDFIAAALPYSLLLLPVCLMGLSLDRPATSAGAEAASQPADGTPQPAGPPAAAVGPGAGVYLLLAGFFSALIAAVVATQAMPVDVLSGLSAALLLVALAGLWIGRLVIVAADGQPPIPLNWHDMAAQYTARLADVGLLVITGSLAGFLLTQTPVVTVTAGLLGQVDIPLLAAILMVVILVGLRQLGVPPPVIVVTVGPILVSSVQLPVMAVSVLLSGATLLSYLPTPLSMVTGIVSSLTGWPPVEVGVVRQGPFVLVGLILLVAYVLVRF